MHIMVDLETMGTTPGSVIASIGAVAFDPQTSEQVSTFYRVISMASCQAAGLTLEADTVKWWLGQGDAAREALRQAETPLRFALQEFSYWWRAAGGIEFWSHGANFDEPMLKAAYDATGLVVPWRYNASRCTRTIFGLADVSVNRDAGTHHNALVDALAQADAVCRAYEKLGLAEKRLPADLDAVAGRWA